MKKIFPTKHTECRNCFWAKWHKGACVLASGFICKLNPFKSIAMGIGGKHLDRKRKGSE